MSQAQVNQSSKVSEVNGSSGSNKSKDAKNPFMNSIFAKLPQMSALEKEDMEMKRYGASNLFTIG